MSLSPTHSPPFALLHRPNIPSLLTLKLDGYLQSKNYTCGFASLLMVVRYLRVELSNEELFEMLETDRSGTSQSKIIETIRNLNLSANVRYDLDLNGIAKNIQSSKPMIAYLVDEEHWVVIYGCDVEKQKIYLADPRPGFGCEYDWQKKQRALNGFGIVCGSKSRLGKEHCSQKGEHIQMEFNLGR